MSTVVVSTVVVVTSPPVVIGVRSGTTMIAPSTGITYFVMLLPSSSDTKRSLMLIGMIVPGVAFSSTL